MPSRLFPNLKLLLTNIYFASSFLDKISLIKKSDLIVDRGDKRELCAGSVALVFEKMGGEVIYFGKPFPEVYNQSINNKKKSFVDWRQSKYRHKGSKSFKL